MDTKANQVVDNLLQDLRDKCHQVRSAGDLIDDVAKTLGATQAEREALRERVDTIKQQYLG